MTEKVKYSALIGILKTIKNSIILFLPPIILIIEGLPVKYAWFAGPIAYFLKNLYEIKFSNKNK
jgi:hypothetical protein